MKWNDESLNSWEWSPIKQLEVGIRVAKKFGNPEFNWVRLSIEQAEELFEIVKKNENSSNV